MDGAKAAARRAGKQVIDLSVGVSDLPPPPEALQTLKASGQGHACLVHLQSACTLPSFQLRLQGCQAMHAPHARRVPASHLPSGSWDAATHAMDQGLGMHGL